METKDSIGKGEVILYQTEDGQTQLDVKLENETVWLSQGQMATLFQRDRTVITRHIQNIFKEGELDKEVVCAKYAYTTPHGAMADKYQTGEVVLYNLDVIISVGYRVKSARGTQFRIWANRVLKDYLIRGFAVKKDLAQQKYEELKQLVSVMGRTMSYVELKESDADQLQSVFEVVQDYTYALDTLDSYDYQTLKIEQTTRPERFHATYDNAMDVIRELKAKFGGSSLFGNEKDQSFHSSIGQIYQTWNGQELYPSIEEKAAMLLYLVTKNHSFSDGNKRIAATLFLWFMDRNGVLYGENGRKRIADNALVALTLMIAESRMDEMDTMIKLTVSLINARN